MGELGIILGLVWYAWGVAGFTYWYTRDPEFGLNPFFWIIFPLTGVIGPCAWGFGYILHGRALPSQDRGNK